MDWKITMYAVLSSLEGRWEINVTNNIDDDDNNNACWLFRAIMTTMQVALHDMV